MSTISKLVCERTEICNKLQRVGFYRDSNEFSIKDVSSCTKAITWNTKSDIATIMYSDEPVDYILDELVKNRQYTILLYDKSIFLVEYTIRNQCVNKQRMIFIKRNNQLSDVNEIKEFDNEDNWDEISKNSPIVLRIDYDSENQSCTRHPKSHLTINSIENCRIAIKSNISFSKFVDFIMKNVYGEYLDFNSGITFPETITDVEKKELHIDWRE